MIGYPEGIVMAVSLIAVFACEQKQPVNDKTPVSIAPVTEEAYTFVEQMPEYIGGESELRNFLINSVKYPDEAKKKGIQGKIFVSFVVAKDGSVTEAKIVRGVDPLLDAEALRVVNAMPKWVPGKQNGKDVPVQFTVPIKFELE